MNYSLDDIPRVGSIFKFNGSNFSTLSGTYEYTNTNDKCTLLKVILQEKDIRSCDPFDILFLMIFNGRKIVVNADDLLNVADQVIPPTELANALYKDI